MGIRKKKCENRYSHILICIFVLSVHILPASFFQYQSELDPLDEILQKAGDYCTRLKQIALHFVCEEHVHEKIYHPYRVAFSRGKSSRGWKTEENHYIYDYQLIRQDKIIEKRILLEENNNKTKTDSAPLKTKRFFYKNLILGPIGLFDRNVQQNFIYRVTNETALWKHPVLVLDISPRQKDENTGLYGKAWVDKDDGSILKIEWEERSIEDYKAMKEFAEKYGMKPQFRFMTEFKIQKNTIRFPNKFVMKEHYIKDLADGWGTRLIMKSSIGVDYRNYKFFIVETDVKY